jgi:hypothetical protein
VTLLLAYGGLTMIVTALLSFVGSHPFPIADAVGRSVVIGAILMLIAGSILRYHLMKGLSSAQGDGRVDGPNARVLHSYIGVVSFFFVILGMLSLGISIYLICQLIGPGIFGSIGGDATDTARVLLDVLYVLVASAGIVMFHWRMSPTGLMRRSEAAVAAPTA